MGFWLTKLQLSEGKSNRLVAWLVQELAHFAEREQLRTPFACKDTHFPRDYRRITAEMIVNYQLSIVN
jgi:hypothetical protein